MIADFCGGRVTGHAANCVKAAHHQHNKKPFLVFCLSFILIMMLYNTVKIFMSDASWYIDRRAGVCSPKSRPHTPAHIAAMCIAV